MKKVFLIFLVLLFSVSMVFAGIGCKGQTAETTAAETTAAETTAAETTAAETTAAETTAAAESVTIKMWDYQTAEAWNSAYNEIIAEFQKTYPNVTIERLAQTHEGGEELVKSSLLAGDYPDLVPIEPGFAESTVEAGYIIDLEPIIKADPEWFSWVEGYISDPGIPYKGKGIWRISADTYHIVVFYFKDIVKQYGGIDPARTITDYEENDKLFKAEGILTLGNTYQGNYQAANSFGVFVTQQVGNSKDAWEMFRQAANGEISWQNDIFKTALEGVVRLYALGSDDAISLAYDESVARLLGKKAVYNMYLGSWMLGDIEKQLASDVEAGNVGVLLYPAITDEIKTLFYGGGIGAHYSISSKPEGYKKEIVLKWAKFINSPQASAIFLKNSIMPAGAPVDNPGEIVSPFFTEYLNVVNNGQMTPQYNISLVNSNPEVGDTFLTGFAELFSGMTIDEYLANMDNVCGFKG